MTSTYGDGLTGLICPYMKPGVTLWFHRDFWLEDVPYALNTHSWKSDCVPPWWSPMCKPYSLSILNNFTMHSKKQNVQARSSRQGYQLWPPDDTAHPPSHWWPTEEPAPRCTESDTGGWWCHSEGWEERSAKVQWERPDTSCKTRHVFYIISCADAIELKSFQLTWILIEKKSTVTLGSHQTRN